MRRRIVTALLFCAGVVGCKTNIVDQHEVSVASITKPLEVFIHSELTIEPYLDEALPAGEQNAASFTVQLSLPWSGAISVSHVDAGDGVVASCEDFFHAERLQQEPVRSFEFGPYQNVGKLCHMLKQAAQLRLPQASFLTEFVLDRTVADQLPVDFALFISESEHLRSLKNPELTLWSDVEKIIRVEGVNAHQAILYAEGTRHELTIMAKGDMNKDNIDDILIRLVSSVEGGSYVTTRGYVLTQKSADSNIELLTSF